MHNEGLVALHALQERRNQFESALSQASADGVIAPYERRELRASVWAITNLEDQFALRRGPGVWGRGGGPGWHGRHHHYMVP